LTGRIDTAVEVHIWTDEELLALPEPRRTLELARRGARIEGTEIVEAHDRALWIAREIDSAAAELGDMTGLGLADELRARAYVAAFAWAPVDMAEEHARITAAHFLGEVIREEQERLDDERTFTREATEALDASVEARAARGLARFRARARAGRK
jgi:hypothetical protein